MGQLLERYKRQAIDLDRKGVLISEDHMLEIMRLEQAEWKPRQMALHERGVLTALGTTNFQDTWSWLEAAPAAVTLASTSKMLVPATPKTLIQASQWTLGKIFRIMTRGIFTSAATPGNLTFEMRLATSDNTGTILATSAAMTWVASQTNKAWSFDGTIECKANGPTATSGTLFATGQFECDGAAIAAGTIPLPASAPADTTSLDLTAATGISLQAKRSGSTAETMQVYQQVLTGLN